MRQGHRFADSNSVNENGCSEPYMKKHITGARKYEAQATAHMHTEGCR